MDDREEEILSKASSPKELKEYAQEKVDVSGGEFGATYALGDTLNLNAIAIGLGLENIEYQPEEFLGLVYRTKPEIDTSVILLWDGRVTAVDAPTEQKARESIVYVAERLDSLNDYSGEGDILWEISVPEETEIEVSEI